MTRLVRILVPIAVPVLLIAFWFIASAQSSSPFFPSLERIIGEIVALLQGDFVTRHIVPSLTNFVIGFAIATVFGIVTGVLLGRHSRMRRAFYPILEFARATPVAALVPAALLLIGSGRGMEVSLIAFGSTWFILVSTVDGVRSIDQRLVDSARVYGLSKTEVLARVVLPAALPQIASGIRIALAVGITIMVIANMYGASSGLGYAVISAQQSFDVLGMWGALLILGLIGAVVNLSFILIQHIALAWHRGWRAATQGAES